MDTFVPVFKTPYPLKLKFFHKFGILSISNTKLGIYSPNLGQTCNLACWIQSNDQFFSTRFINSQNPRWWPFCKWNWNIAFAHLFSDTKLDTHSPYHGQRCIFACWIRSNDQFFSIRYSKKSKSKMSAIFVDKNVTLCRPTLSLTPTIKYLYESIIFWHLSL